MYLWSYFKRNIDTKYRFCSPDRPYTILQNILSSISFRLNRCVSWISSALFYNFFNCTGRSKRRWRKKNGSIFYVQSTLVISNSKGLSETLRDIRTSTYKIFRIEEKVIRTTTFNKYICNWTLDVTDISKILWKREEISFSTIFFTCC